MFVEKLQIMALLPFYVLFAIFGVIRNVTALKLMSTKNTKKIQRNLFAAKKCLENLPFNVLNSTEFKTFAKFDVIETQDGANIRLTPTPSQQKIINRLKNLVQQKKKYFHGKGK